MTVAGANRHCAFYISLAVSAPALPQSFAGESSNAVRSASVDPPPFLKGGRHTITVGGLQRTFLLDRPKDLKSGTFLDATVRILHDTDYSDTCRM